MIIYSYCLIVSFKHYHDWSFLYTCTNLTLLVNFYTLPHDSGGVLWCHIGRPWVCLLYVRFSFLDDKITWVNINRFSRNLVCALILWRSGLGLLMGKFCQIFMEVSDSDTTMAGYYSLKFFIWKCRYQKMYFFCLSLLFCANAFTLYKEVRVLLSSIMCPSYSNCLTVLGFNDTSTLVGHFVSSPREREKGDSRGDVSFSY